MKSDAESINLESIDWNNLSVDAFQDLHTKLEVIPKERKPRSENNKFESIKIQGKFYSVPMKMIIRLNNMKSIKSKEKLQEEIQLNYTPIMEV